LLDDAVGIGPTRQLPYNVPPEAVEGGLRTELVVKMPELVLRQLMPESVLEPALHGRAASWV